MNELEHQNLEGRSLLSLATAILRNRWRISLWMFTGATIATAGVFKKPALYVASASFYPENLDAAGSGIASLAGQFGLSLPVTAQSRTPEFYVALLKSRVLLQKVVLDTFVVQEMGKQPISFLDLFEIEEELEASRVDEGVKLLSGIVSARLGPRNTGTVEVSVATEWADASLAILTALLEGQNEHNRGVTQGQAGDERRFIEDRLKLASTELREAEDRVEIFLNSNKQYNGSPELVFEFERLQRELSLRQGLHMSLMQSYEDVRLREVRDAPAVVMVDLPAVPSLPGPRGRLVYVVLGMLVGGLIGSLIALSYETMARLRTLDDAEVGAVVRVLGEVRSEIMMPFRRIAGLMRR